jgi:hypothetical protein
MRPTPQSYAPSKKSSIDHQTSINLEKPAEKQPVQQAILKNNISQISKIYSNATSDKSTKKKSPEYKSVAIVKNDRPLIRPTSGYANSNNMEPVLLKMKHNGYPNHGTGNSGAMTTGHNSANTTCTNFFVNGSLDDNTANYNNEAKPSSSSGFTRRMANTAKAGRVVSAVNGRNYIHPTVDKTDVTRVPQQPAHNLVGVSSPKEFKAARGGIGSVGPSGSMMEDNWRYSSEKKEKYRWWRGVQQQWKI